MKKRRVLLIDDEKAVRETLSQVLTDEGYVVTSVASGEEGLRRLTDEPFDLAFLDVWLRDRDGLSILEAARERLREVPVIMISGHASVETAVKAVRLGAEDFLEKPLSLERVLLTAQKAIERRSLLAQIASFRGKSEPEELVGDSIPDAPPEGGDRPRGAHRRPRPDHRRERNRQGARRPRASTGSPRGPTRP